MWSSLVLWSSLGIHEGSPYERVEQRGLARVGIADNCDDRNALFPPLAPVLAPVRSHVLDLALQVGDMRPDLAPVNFQLALTGSAQADAASAASPRCTARLSCEVRPHAGQPRQAILVLREFDLQRAFFGARVLRENIENQRGAVEDFDVLAAKRLLDLALLVGVQFLVKDQEVVEDFLALRDDLAQLALADQSGRVDSPDLLRRLPDDADARGARQLREFVHRIVGGESVLLALHFHADEVRALDGWFGGDGGVSRNVVLLG